MGSSSNPRRSWHSFHMSRQSSLKTRIFPMFLCQHGDFRGPCPQRNSHHNGGIEIPHAHNYKEHLIWYEEMNYYKSHCFVCPTLVFTKPLSRPIWHETKSE
mmetsp:Transcript_15475/g.29271  ORF Transcript_15475/g.29271 Transcript_15475/m.29271 type:complete len:101 (+) Transcript_15475:656-958(+)